MVTSYTSSCGFFWCACTGLLPTMRELSLYGKHITSDSLCPSCKVESDDCCYQFFYLIYGASAAQCELVKGDPVWF